MQDLPTGPDWDAGPCLLCCVRCLPRLLKRQLLGIADATGVAPDSCLDTCTPQEQPGMVRVSLGLYNTRADVDAAADALADIAARPDAYRSKYRALRNGHGDWAHTDFNVPPHELLTLEGAADDWVRDALSS